MPELLRKLERNDARLFPQTRLALKLLVLTFTRKKELAHAKWEEINFDDKTWIIAAERMKMKREHTIPITQQSLRLIERIKPISGHRKYLFPSNNNPKNHSVKLHPKVIHLPL